VLVEVIERIEAAGGDEPAVDALLERGVTGRGTR
jgi:hypothetical protein